MILGQTLLRRIFAFSQVQEQEVQAFTGVFIGILLSLDAPVVRPCPKHPNHLACPVSRMWGLCRLLGEQKGLVELADGLDVCEDLECTPGRRFQVEVSSRTLQEGICV